jgi:hypothetical protein
VRPSQASSRFENCGLGKLFPIHVEYSTVPRLESAVTLSCRQTRIGPPGYWQLSSNESTVQLGIGLLGNAVGGWIFSDLKL